MEVIFNMHKIKYADMNKILGEPNKGSYQLFINLEPLLRKLIRANIEEYIKSADMTLRVREFISNVLNLVAHYRKYFTGKGKKTEIIVYMAKPDATFINSMIYEDYRNNMKDIHSTRTVFGKFLREILEPIQLFFTFIEGIYFVTTDNIEPSLVPALMKNDMANQIILTTDRYEYQYVNMDYTILRPKAKGMSYCITKHNAISRMKKEDGVINDKEVGANFIPLILSFIGDAKRSIPKVKGIGISKIVDLLRDGIDKGNITESTSNIHLLETLLNDDLREVIKRNYIITDINTQLFSVGESTKLILLDGKVDRFDNVSLKRLNDIFDRFPIMLEELQPLKDKPKSVFER